MINKSELKDFLKELTDRIFWGTPVKDSSQITYLHKEDKSFYASIVNVSDPIVCEEFSKQNKLTTLHEYLFGVDGPVIFDPDFGWAINSKGKVIKYSFNKDKVAKPSILRFLKFKYLKRGNVINATSVFSFRHHAEDNFFHFWNDIVGRIWILEKYNLLQEVNEIIVSQRVFNMPYFQFLLNNTFLNTKKILAVSGDDYVMADKAFFVVAPIISQLNFLKLRELFPNELFKIQPFEKVFVYRTENSTRSLKNNDEVIRILFQRGFQAVNFEDISFKSQIEIIKGAKILVMVHGAAITNLIFHNNPSEVRLLEIMPKNRICTEFFMMGQVLGLKKYDVYVSEKLDEFDKSYVVLNEFSEALEKFLSDVS